MFILKVGAFLLSPIYISSPFSLRIPAWRNMPEEDAGPGLYPTTNPIVLSLNHKLGLVVCASAPIADFVVEKSPFPRAFYS
jgi:hypothetical protein